MKKWMDKLKKWLTLTTHQHVICSLIFFLLLGLFIVDLLFDLHDRQIVRTPPARIVRV